MNSKIIKKISEKVKFEVTKDDRGNNLYNVYHMTDENEWKKILSTNRIEKALNKKHNFWIGTISKLGYTCHLLGRRRKRERQKKAKLKITKL